MFATRWQTSPRSAPPHQVQRPIHQVLNKKARREKKKKKSSLLRVFFINNDIQLSFSHDHSWQKTCINVIQLMCSELCLLFLFIKSITFCFIDSIFCSQDQSSQSGIVMLSHEIFWLYRDYISPGKSILSMHLSKWVLWVEINICI